MEVAEKEVNRFQKEIMELIQLGEEYMRQSQYEKAHGVSPKKIQKLEKSFRDCVLKILDLTPKLQKVLMKYNQQRLKELTN